MSDLCVECGETLQPLQHAFSCDICEQWQHKTCNIGICKVGGEAPLYVHNNRTKIIGWNLNRHDLRMWQLIFLLIARIISTDTQTVCKDAPVLPELERRARNYAAGGSTGNDAYINDALLIEQWYSVRKYDKQYRMPDSTSMPDYSTCGTYEPIYVKDLHPDENSLSEVPVDVVTCLRSTFGDCDIKFVIQIRKCQDEIQYNLVQVKGQSAFCFDPPELQGGSSTFSPPPQGVDVGQVQVDPELRFKEIPVSIKGQDTINYTPYNVFKCLFTLDKQYFYYVDWYITEQMFQSYGPTDDNEALYLSEDKLIAENIPPGINIKCGVRVAADETGMTTQLVSSPSFFAGIELVKPVVIVPQKSQGQLEFRLTVPVGCQYNSGNVNPPCDLSISMFDPNGYTCDVSNILQSSNRCGKTVKGLKKGELWDRSHVHAFVLVTGDETKNDNSEYSLRLKTAEYFGHRWWMKYEPDDAQVHVLKDTSKFQLCYSHVDPHMKTVDGHYYENQNSGEYLMYRNIKFGIEVQEKYISCNNRRAWCTCGVIVNAGADVFAVNKCGKYAFTGFLRCGDNGILKVHKPNDRRFQIFTPIGTWIDIAIRTSYSRSMNVDIYMAKKDKDRTEGLCGTYDGNRNNDLKTRSGSIIGLTKYPKTFTNSWRLSDEENLFKSFRNNFQKWEHINQMYCVCPHAMGENPSQGHEAVAHCAPTQYMNCIKYEDVTNRYCKITGSRKRRMATSKHEREMMRLMAKSMIDDENLIYKREAVENSTISYELAAEHCANAINSSVAVTNNFESLGGEDPNTVIENCISDVQTGDNLDLTRDHIDALNNIVEKELEKDPEYVANNTEKVNTFIQNSCPFNCSEKGVCSENGICQCEEHTHGSDCGIDERDPLHIDDMEGGGFCNITDGDGCTCFYLRTDNLLLNFTCQISGSRKLVNGQEEIITTKIKEGEYIDVFTAICCVESEGQEIQKRSIVDSEHVFWTRYDIALSNNGLNFGESEPIRIFDSVCQDVTDDGQGHISIILKDDFCFIDGSCVWANEESVSDSCFACSPDSDHYNWTMTCVQPNNNQSNLGVILGLTLGSLAAVCIVLVVVIIWQMKFKPQLKKRKSVGSSQQFTQAD